MCSLNIFFIYKLSNSIILNFVICCPSLLSISESSSFSKSSIFVSLPVSYDAFDVGGLFSIAEAGEVYLPGLALPFIGLCKAGLQPFGGFCSPFICFWHDTNGFVDFSLLLIIDYYYSCNPFLDFYIHSYCGLLNQFSSPALCEYFNQSINQSIKLL